MYAVKEKPGFLFFMFILTAIRGLFAYFFEFLVMINACVAYGSLVF